MTINSFARLTLLVAIFSVALVSSYAEQKGYQFVLKSRTVMNYPLYEPTAELEKVDGKFPLLLFLHGGGEGGDDIERVKKHGPPKLIEQGRKFPFFVLSPQNPYERGFWDDRAVHALLKKVIAEHPVDPTRIYLAGLSRGGYGAWRLLVNYPNQFAAGVVVCGASAPKH